MPTGKKNDFASLLEEYTTALPKAGDLVKGKVVSIDNGAVRLDIEGVATGVVRGPELFVESAQFSNFKVGDDAEATVINPENELGEIELSFRVAGKEIVWAKMRSLVEEGLTVSAKVTAANKGGVMMKIDALTGFMPVSQLNPEHYPRVQGGDKNKILEKLRELIGQELQVKVLDAIQKDEKLIVSEKAVWEDEQKAVLDSYTIGDEIEGEISALTSFGAFMRFGEGLEGLIHISEIAWQRIDHPKDVLKIGDRVKAQIIDLNKSKIYLSMKRLVTDPWKVVKDKYTLNQEVQGEVHKIEPFGLMVKLDTQIHGLAHVSELSNKPMSDEEVKKAFPIGTKHDFVIVNIEPAEHRLGLRVKGVEPKVKKAKPEAKKAEEKTEESVEAKAEEKA